MSEASIDVPKVGKVKKQYVYVAVGGVAVYVGWRYFMAARANAATPETEFAAADTPVAAGSYVNPDPNAPVDTTAGPSITTNAEWSAAVTDALATAGYDTTFVAQTVGKYLAKQTLSQDEAALIRTALAYVGQPPVGSFNVLLVTTGGTTTTTDPLAAEKKAFPQPTRKKSWTGMKSPFPGYVYPSGLADWSGVENYYYEHVRDDNRAHGLQFLINANGGKPYRNGMKVILPAAL